MTFNWQCLVLAQTVYVSTSARLRSPPSAPWVCPNMLYVLTCPLNGVRILCAEWPLRLAPVGQYVAAGHTEAFPSRQHGTHAAGPGCDACDPHPGHILGGRRHRGGAYVLACCFIRMCDTFMLHVIILDTATCAVLEAVLFC